jgi:hypothetical protein
MRVTTSVWVSALVRRCYAEGAFPAIVRHGADQAGAIFIVVDHMAGTADLYAPAPQSSFDETTPDRLFQRILENVQRDAISARLEREIRFDPDLWIVEVEDREARTFFETV